MNKNGAHPIVLFQLGQHCELFSRAGNQALNLNTGDVVTHQAQAAATRHCGYSSKNKGHHYRGDSNRAPLHGGAFYASPVSDYVSINHHGECSTIAGQLKKPGKQNFASRVLFVVF
jgi:hypothetical protein